MASATFNDVPLGDPDNGVRSLRAGNIDLTVQVDAPLGLDGVVTRPRGGGCQTLVLEAWKHCASTAERLGYLEGLVAACGSAKATLAYTGDGGPRAWSECLLTAAREDRAAGADIEFTLVFVRSAL